MQEDTEQQEAYAINEKVYIIEIIEDLLFKVNELVFIFVEGTALDF